jgi:hypothetical protein
MKQVNFLTTAPENPFMVRPSASLADIAAMVPPPAFEIKPGAKAVCTKGKIVVYLAGCRALATIAKKLGVVVLKVGITGASPKGRIERLGEGRYAGYWGRQDDLIALQGAEKWEQFRIPQAADIRPDSHQFAQLSGYGDIHLKVPQHVSRESVDAAVAHILEKRSLKAFLRSDAGQIRCRQAGVDALGWFYTYYPERSAHSPVQELYLIDPKRDAGWLIAALDGLGRHLHLIAE